MPQHPESRQRRVLYSGHVQGVGFRYTCASLAKRYPVDGYVKNLPNGSVELVVSGRDREVEKFLADIADAFRSNIDSATNEEIQLSQPLNGFHVRF